MEDDKIKNLFDNYQPRLSSTDIFLSRLRQNMDAVEMIKKQVAVSRRRNKIAVIISALAGFVSGVVMTLLMPAMSQWLSSIKISLPEIGLNTINFDGPVLAWMITAAISGLIAYNSYQMVSSKLSAGTINR